MKTLETKVVLLKSLRLKILALHKALLDEERSIYEQNHGQINSGQFLNLLVNDENFQWLRMFSALIVEIDEALDLDDGFTENMINDYLLKIRNLFSLEHPDANFNLRYENFIQNNSGIALKHDEIRDLAM